MIRIIYSFFSLVRFKNILIAISCVLLSAHILSIEDYFIISLCILLVSSSMGFGNILNDIIDYDNDKINHPNRVLPQHKINLKTAYFFLYLCLLITIIGAIFISPMGRFSLLIIHLLLLLYNYFLKDMVLIGNLIIAMLLSTVLIFTEILLLQTYTRLLIPAFLAFGISLIREIIKDLEDISGDKQTNRNTLPIYFGIKKSILFTQLLIILFNIFSFYLYFIYYNSILYLFSLIILVEIPLLLSLFLLINNPDKRTFRKIAKITKYITVSGLLVLFLANMR